MLSGVSNIAKTKKRIKVLILDGKKVESI